MRLTPFEGRVRDPHERCSSCSRPWGPRVLRGHSGRCINCEFVREFVSAFDIPAHVNGLSFLGWPTPINP